MFNFRKSKGKKIDLFEKGEKGNPKCDRYSILFDIGAGGQAHVYVAEDSHTREPVAIKIYPQSKRSSSTKGEVKVLEHLRRKGLYGNESANKYVIEFKESFWVERSLEKHDKFELWIVQEFCECGDLFHVMKRLKRPFTCEEIKHIISNVLLGLRFIHSRKIVHRDLKCLNILLTRAGRVKICDFGHAEVVNYDLEHDVIESKATDCWMAPEMFKDGAYYGYEVDIWALGVCLIEMSKMRPPFDDQHGDMVASQVLNLPALRLEQQRELLGLDRPPEDLTERCTSQRNNYWNFYTEEFKFLSTENDFETSNADIKKKHLSVHAESHLHDDDSDVDIDEGVVPENLSTKSGVSSETGSSYHRKRQSVRDNLFGLAKNTRRRRNTKRGSEAPHAKNKSTFKSGPLSINIHRKRKNRKSVKANRKKHSLVTELFNIRNSILRRSKKRTETPSKLKQKLATLQKQRDLGSDPGSDYDELIKEPDQIIFTEFTAWCLHTEQSKRPNIFDLLSHPFVENEVKSLSKYDKSECSIIQHSDFLLRTNILQANDIRAEEADELESDDDCFLTEDEKRNEIYKEEPILDTIKEVCTCSTSQVLVRESICDNFAKVSKEIDGRRSPTRMIE